MTGLTESQWRRRKDEILSLLEDCCNFEIHVGGANNSLTFVIKEVYSEMPPLMNKKVVTREEKLKDYEKFTLEELPSIRLIVSLIWRATLWRIKS